MVNMDELHQELMVSQKNDELTQKANDMLVDYTNEVFEKWYDISGKYLKTRKEELLSGGMNFVFKHWKNFNGEKFKDPGRYFKEIFKRGLADYHYKSTKEYKEKRFLDSLHSMGIKILKFDLPYEMELDGSTIRKFSFVDKNREWIFPVEDRIIKKIE